MAAVFAGRPFFSGACRDFWVESPYTFCHSFFLQAGIALFAGADISMVLGSLRCLFRTGKYRKSTSV